MATDYVSSLMKNRLHQPTSSVVLPQVKQPHQGYQNFTVYNDDSDRFKNNYTINSINPVQSQQIIPDNQQRLDNYSINFNSIGSRSLRGYTSNYMLNENVFSNGDIDSDQFEGTYNQNNHELLELSRDLDQHPQMYTLTETEVRDIVKRFNESLNKHTLETTELEKRVKILIDMIDDKQAIARQLYKERENVILEIENRELASEKAIKTLSALELNRQQFDDSKIISDLEEVSRELLHKQELEKKKQDLLQKNESLRRQITQKYVQTKIKETKCNKCRLYFLPINNQDDSCRFHFGKLKFFSCRGCGSDQYYSCCNKCGICSSGCKTAKHIA